MLTISRDVKWSKVPTSDMKESMPLLGHRIVRGSKNLHWMAHRPSSRSSATRSIPDVADRRRQAIRFHSQTLLKRSPRMPGSLVKAVFISRSKECPMPNRSVERSRRWSKVFSKLGIVFRELLRSEFDEV